MSQHDLTKANLQSLSTLKKVMQALRDPNVGCPWDIRQTHKTIAPYAIEEAYEVVDAITSNDMDALRDELGDLLLQVIFHAQMAHERNDFSLEDVIEAIKISLGMNKDIPKECNTSTITEVNLLAEED